MDDTAAHIGIGSNLGDRVSLCRRAIDEIGKFPRSHVSVRASFYDTEPLEYSDQERFINTVVEVRTELAPEDLFAACLDVERLLGRERAMRYGPRTIDLDLLLYGDAVVRSEYLVLPHPKLHLRRFVLEPLAEIAPGAVHPVLKRRIRDLLEELAEDQDVRRFPVSGTAPSGQP